MFDSFTDVAKAIMAMANQEAQKHNHEYIGTEHILLALIDHGQCSGINILRELNVNTKAMKIVLEQDMSSDPDMVTM